MFFQEKRRSRHGNLNREKQTSSIY
jgi:hypothetical protein